MSQVHSATHVPVHSYSAASYAGANGNGTVYRIGLDGCFAVLHTFSATDPTTGANEDGATPDYGVILDGNLLIGMADYGGSGSPGGFSDSGGTLYQLTLDEFWRRVPSGRPWLRPVPR